MTPVRARAVVFDFDGVLVDSEPARFKAGARALEEIGVCLTWERFLTGSRRIEVERILGRLALSHRFHAIVTAEDYARAKPAPDPFLAAAHLLDVSPSSCLVIEDSPAGVAAARVAGMPVVAVDRRRTASGLDHATWTVASLDELILSAEGDIIVTPATRLSP